MEIRITNGTLTGVSSVLTAASSFSLPSDVTVSGANKSYISSTGALSLSSITSSVVVTASGVASQSTHGITCSLTNLTSSGDSEISSTATVTLSPAAGYRLPVKISVTGASFTYNDATGVISLTGATGAVTITAAALTSKERVLADLKELGDIINEKAGSSGKKNVAQIKAAAKSISTAAGTEGTPTASKGTVSNHTIEVTPSVTNTEGYITGGTRTGTPVTVSASELVSGSVNITGTSQVDVTNYETAQVVDSNLASANIKNGVTILGVTGSALTVTVTVNQDNSIDLTIA